MENFGAKLDKPDLSTTGTASPLKLIVGGGNRGKTVASKLWVDLVLSVEATAKCEARRSLHFHFAVFSDNFVFYDLILYVPSSAGGAGRRMQL